MFSIRPKWKGTMSDRERFVAQMHHRPVDRCFNMEFGYWNENFTAWKIFRDHGITRMFTSNSFMRGTVA